MLGDGRELILRPIESADADAMRRGFDLLTADEIRLRFLHPLKELTPAMAQKLASPDPQRELALVAAEPLPPGEALVGAVARAAIDPDGRSAEFALLVARLLGRQGLGRLMLKKIIHWCRLKRIETLYGDVLDENTPMLELARSLGFRRTHKTDDPGLTRVVLDLKPRASTH